MNIQGTLTYKESGVANIRPFRFDLYSEMASNAANAVKVGADEPCEYQFPVAFCVDHQQMLSSQLVKTEPDETSNKDIDSYHEQDTVEELLVKAEQLLSGNNALIDQYRSDDLCLAFNDINETGIPDEDMDQIVRHTLAEADRAIEIAQSTLDESSIEGKIYE